MSLDDQPKNEAPHGAGVGTTPRGWGSGRQRGWVRGLSRLDFGVKASVLPGVYLAGEEPQLLGAGQGFRGQLVGENHHLCLQTIETPSQAVSLLSPPPPPPQPPSPPPWPRVGTTSPFGCQGVLDGRFGGSGSQHQFPSSLFPSHQE